MKKTFNITKTFSYDITSVLVGNFLNYYIFKIDINFENTFDNAILKIGKITSLSSILEYNISNKTTTISLDNVGLEAEDLYLTIEGTPTEGNGNITIYYLDSSSYIIKTITYQDFINSTYSLGIIPSTNRVSDVIFNIVESFNTGKVELKQDTTTIIEKTKVDLLSLRKYIFEYHEEHLPQTPFTLSFEDYPSKGEFQISLLYFPIQ